MQFFTVILIALVFVGSVRGHLHTFRVPPTRFVDFFGVLSVVCLGMLVPVSLAWFGIIGVTLGLSWVASSMGGVFAALMFRICSQPRQAA